jgi:DNA polymerase-3 subunit beta
MKISCKKHALLEGLQLLGHVTAGTTTKPILQAIKMEAIENRLILEATDLEVGIRYEIESVEVEEKGTVVLHGGRIAELLREWPEEEVNMELKGKGCSLSGEGGTFKVSGYDPEEFPTIPVFKEEGSIEVEAADLADMVRKVAFACATERVRHTMTGVLFQMEGGGLKMVATDGRRLACVKGKKGEEGRKEMEGIVPRKGVEQMARIAGQEEGKIKIKIGETHLHAKSNRATLCTQLIEGQYPNYKEAIPGDTDKKVEIDVETLASAIRRATVLTTEERRLVKLKLQKGKLSVEAETPEVGEAKVDVGVSYSGASFEVGFNPLFLLDALKAIGKGEIKMEFKEPTSATVIRSGQDFLYVVMPIRLTEAG